MLQIRSVSRRALPGILLSATLLSGAAYAKADGSITGRSAGTTAGCGTCHGTRSNDTSVRIDGPLQVEKGSTTTYKVTITGEGTKGGVNIKASSGQLAPVSADSSLRLNGGELTHSAPKTATSGVVEFSFNLVAPSEDKAILLTAVGNSVNGDGDESDLDQWNFAQPLTVAAGNPTEGPDVDTESGGCSTTGSASAGFVALVLLALLFRRPPAYQRQQARRRRPSKR